MASWDRMVVPHPFTRAIFLYGDPIMIARDEDVEQERRYRQHQQQDAEAYWQPRTGNREP